MTTEMFVGILSLVFTVLSAGISIGLYIANKILQAHFGKIYIKSYPDDVNIFGFYFPIRNQK